ncbi:MAG: radical SAM protein [archaeon]
MDLMLIYPPLSVEERYARKTGKNIGGHLPPLGIATLGAFAREHKFSVDVLDCLALDINNQDILNRIDKNKPKVVGFSCLTTMFHRAKETALLIRKRFPDILIIIGGHHATIMPIDIIKDDDCFDLLVFGEGELTLLEILNEYKKDKFSIKKFLTNYKKLNKIKGIVFREKNKIVKTLNRDLIKNIDSLPYPARDLLPMDKYIPLPNQYKRTPVVHMVAIRGCPYQCSFCSNNAVFGRGIRARSPKKVVEEIKYLIKTYNVREISFWDDMMTVNKKWMEELCNEIINQKIDITWTGYARVDTVNIELLRLMKRAGCWNIFYGYEAGVQELLDNIDKGITLRQIEDANKWTKEAGIEVRASFMIALPGETPELAKKTIEFAKRLNPDYAQFSITTPFPGTKLWNNAEKFGRINKDFKNYNGWEPVFVPYGYKDEEEIMKMEKRAVREFYFRPAFIISALKKIRTKEDIIRYLKGLRFLLGFV